jgi:hypothetical protein
VLCRPAFPMMPPFSDALMDYDGANAVSGNRNAVEVSRGAGTQLIASHLRPAANDDLRVWQ